jgi:ligand-binding sensor domain-containing protein
MSPLFGAMRRSAAILASRDRRLITAGNSAARDFSSALRWSDATSNARKRSSKLVGDTEISFDIKCDATHLAEYDPLGNITPIHVPTR